MIVLNGNKPRRKPLNICKSLHMNILLQHCTSVRFLVKQKMPKTKIKHSSFVSKIV